jgi:Reversibly glycosylated polypeptide
MLACACHCRNNGIAANTASLWHGSKGDVPKVCNLRQTESLLPLPQGTDFVRGYPFSLREGVPTAVSHGEGACQQVGANAANRTTQAGYALAWEANRSVLTAGVTDCEQGYG